MARVFVSYRIADSAGHAGRLADALKSVFGRNDVFLGADDIAGGAPWRQVLTNELRRSRVVPDEWKRRAGEVQRAIEQPLSDKAITLREIAQQLRLPDASREQLMKESEMTVALVNEVRSHVNAIITELARPSPVPAQ